MPETQSWLLRLLQAWEVLSQSRRAVWVGNDLQRSLVQPSCSEQGHLLLQRIPHLNLQQDLGLAEGSAGEAGVRDPSLPIVSVRVVQPDSLWWRRGVAVGLTMRTEGSWFATVATWGSAPGQLAQVLLGVSESNPSESVSLSPSPCEFLGIRDRWLRALRCLGWPWGGSDYNANLRRVNAVSRLRVWHSGKSQDLVLCCYFFPHGKLTDFRMTLL